MKNDELRLALLGETGALKELWHKSFEDAPEYIELFFDHCFAPERTPVLVRNGRIISALHLLPTAGIMGLLENAVRCGYVYAFATHPDKRGQGLGTVLLQWAEELFCKQGIDFFLLHPGRVELVDYYRRAGYQPMFWMEETVFDQKLCCLEGRLNAASPKKYNAVRRRILTGRVYVDYEPEVLGFLEKLLKSAGGGLFTFVIGGQTGCAAIEPADDGSLLVRELLEPAGRLRLAAALIAAEFPAKNYVIRSPGGSGKPYTMGKPIGLRGRQFYGITGYFPFVFD